MVQHGPRQAHAPAYNYPKDPCAAFSERTRGLAAIAGSMDTQLLSFEYRSRTPEELENFLSEVLQLDVEPVSDALFSVRLGDVLMKVLQGEGSGGKFQLAISPESFADLPARWEFFCFRYGNSADVTFNKAQAVFKTHEGSIWLISAAPTVHPRENFEIPVRNF